MSILIDRLLCDINEHQESLSIEPVENDATGEIGYEAYGDDDDVIGYGISPKAAVEDLARRRGLTAAGPDRRQQCP